MEIATWNINGIRARLDRLLGWLDTARPDAVCLQEIKCVDEQFPYGPIMEAGYHAAAYGQKGFNGVAILSRTEPTEILRGLDDGVDDPQARLLAATVEGVRVVSAYVPNGSEVGSDKYAYKLAWLERLIEYLGSHGVPGSPLALCGDFNIVPEARDAHDPEAWEGTVLFNPQVRGMLDRIKALGLSDSLRKHTDEAGLYSWWDYRRLAFPKNLGLRIDLILCTPGLYERCREVRIDRDERKGEKPSDHVPVIAAFD